MKRTEKNVDMTMRTLRRTALLVVAFVVAGVAGWAWGLEFSLGETKEELKLKYDIAVEEHSFVSGTTLDVTYLVPSIAPNSTFPIRIEFFNADAANQEGQTLLGADSYTAPGSKLATITLGPMTAGSKSVATGTDNNGTANTSEFSANHTVTSPLMATGGAAPATANTPATLTSAQRSPIVDATIARLAAQRLTAAQVRRLPSVTFASADLPGATLGQAAPNAITLDANAAGHIWFVDPKPHDDTEFRSGSRLSTLASSLRMDLLTFVMHELGHTLDRDDLQVTDTEDDLMYEALAAGGRRTSIATAADTVWGGH